MKKNVSGPESACEKKELFCVCVRVFAESDSGAWEEVLEDIGAEGESSTQQAIFVITITTCSIYCSFCGIYDDFKDFCHNADRWMQVGVLVS